MNGTTDFRDECDMLLMDYARGMLNEAQRVLVESYIEISDQARRRAALFERLGGALMEECCEPVAMMEGSLRAVLGRLPECDDGRPCEPYRPRHSINMPMPRPLCVEISVRCGPSAAWRRMAPGVKMLRIMPPGTENGAMYVFHMEPSACLPGHRHGSREITLVLEGAFGDAAGIHRRGDILIMDPGTRHVPQADPQTGCACLVVAETRTGGLPAWVMRLLGRV